MEKMRIGLLSFILLFIVTATCRQTESIETLKRENRCIRFFNSQSIKEALRTLIAACAILLLTCCSRESASLRYALRSACDNRLELKSVLAHYADEPEKLIAARYLISNFPARYSYDRDGIHKYYNYAARILSNTLLIPEQQRDSIYSAIEIARNDIHTKQSAICHRVIWEDRRGIANPEAGQDTIDRAYDGNLLSNFEINQADGNWVGMYIGKPITVQSFSVSPRSDYNDICPRNEYELLYFNGRDWRSLGNRVAETNSLHYDNIPLHTLLWLRNYTRGNNKRPFIIDETGDIEWL